MATACKSCAIPRRHSDQCFASRNIKGLPSKGHRLKFTRELDWISRPQPSSLHRESALPRIRRWPFESQGAATRGRHMAPWNKRKGPDRVKMRREGGHLCRDRPLCLHRQRHGSQHVEWRHGLGWPAGNRAEESFPASRHFSTQFPFVRCVNHAPYLSRLDVNEKTRND